MTQIKRFAHSEFPFDLAEADVGAVHLVPGDRPHLRFSKVLYNTPNYWPDLEEVPAPAEQPGGGEVGHHPARPALACAG